VTRGDASIDLSATVNAFADLMSGLPKELVRPAAWGPREQLAHIVFAHQLYVNCMQAIVAGEKPPLWVGSVHEQNARAVLESEGESAETLVSRLLDVHARFEKLAKSTEVQLAPFYSRKGATRRTFPAALLAIDSHIHGHMREIQRIARRAAVG